MLMPVRIFILIVAASALLAMILFRTLTPPHRTACVRGSASAMFTNCRVMLP